MNTKLSKVFNFVSILVLVGALAITGRVVYGYYVAKDSELTPAQYHVLKEKGTEIPFTSELLKEKRPGTYVTADCNEPVFRSEQKYDSGTGWPSFWAPIEGSVTLQDDNLFGQLRTEVVGSKCGGHLGHVFADGPSPTGLRYCLNGVALKFIPDDPNAPPVIYKIDERTKAEVVVRQ